MTKFQVRNASMLVGGERRRVAEHAMRFVAASLVDSRGIQVGANLLEDRGSPRRHCISSSWAPKTIDDAPEGVSQLVVKFSRSVEDDRRAVWHGRLARASTKTRARRPCHDKLRGSLQANSILIHSFSRSA